MAYANRENGGKTKEQIEGEISEAEGNSVYDKIKYVVKKMINDIKSDENIPYRLTTGGGAEKLRSIIDSATTLDEREKLTGSVSRDWKDYSYIAGEIDEGENHLLNQLKYEGGMRNLRYQLSRANINNFTFNEDGSVTLGECAGTIGNMKNLFYYYKADESYVLEGTSQVIEDLSSNNTVHNLRKKYYFDYSNCSDSVKQQVRDVLSKQNLDELVVIGKATGKGASRTSEPNNEDSLTNLRIEVDIGNVNIYKSLPLAKNLVISDSMAYEGKVKLDKADAQSNLEREELFGLSIEDSEYEKDPRENPKLKDLIYYFGGTDEELTKNKLRIALVNAGPRKYNTFLIETENRIRNIISYIRKSHFDLCRPPILSGKIRFIDSNGKESKIEIWDSDGGTGDIFPSSSNLGKDLYDIIKDHKDAYDEYLKMSVLSKWNQTVFLAPEKDIIKKYETTDGITDADLLMRDDHETNAYIYALKQILNIATDYANNVGNTRSDKDKRLSEVINLLGYSISNLENGKIFSRNEIWKKIINVIISKFTPLCERVNFASQKDLARKAFNEMFSHIRYNVNPDLGTIFNFCRKLSEYYGCAGNFSQGNEIIQATNESGSREIRIGATEEVQNGKYNDLNECLQRIDQLFNLEAQFNENGDLIPNNQTKNIDELFKKFGSTANIDKKRRELFARLSERGITTEGFIRRGNPEKINKIMDAILNKISRRKKEFESNRPTTANIRNGLTNYRDSLNNKSRSEDEEIVFNNLNDFFSMDRNAQNEIIEKILGKNKTILKYQGVNDDIFFPLCMGYADYAGGTNNHILNQIYGFGPQLSDASNAEMLNCIEDVSVTIATWYIGGGVLKAGNCIAKLSKTLIRGSETAKKVINSSKGLVNNVWKCSNNLGRNCFNAIKSRYPESAKKLAKAANRRVKVAVEGTAAGGGTNEVINASNLLKKGFRNFLNDVYKENLNGFIDSVWNDNPPFNTGYGNSPFTEALKSVVILGLKKAEKTASNMISIDINAALDDLPQPAQTVIKKALDKDVVNFLTEMPINFCIRKDAEKYLGNIVMELIFLGNPISKKFRQIYGDIGTDILKKISRHTFSVFCNEGDLYIQEPAEPHRMAKLNDLKEVKELTENYSA